MIACLVLNSSYQPLAVVSAQRGLILVMDGRANIKERMPNRTFHSVRQEFPIPTVIVMNEYKKTGAKYHKAAQLNQRNLFIRDSYTCAYCSRHAMDLRHEPDFRLDLLRVVPEARQTLRDVLLWEFDYIDEVLMELARTNVPQEVGKAGQAEAYKIMTELRERGLPIEATKVAEAEYLTRDHIQPLSRGGVDGWLNVVTACSTCNHGKDDKTPEEAGLKLHTTPREATVYEILKKRQAKLERQYVP